MLSLPKLNRETQSAIFKSFLSALGLSSLFYSSGAFAQSSTTSLPSLQTMVENFATAVPNLMQLTTATCYVMGMVFVMSAIMGMKHFGEMRTMQSQEHGIFGPMVKLLIGCAMIYLPSSIHTVLYTFWTSTNPYAYQTGNTQTNATFWNTCYSIVQLIGVIAFVRGLMLLQQAGSERAQPHMLGKAAAHLIGGVLCINIYNTITMLETTVGMLS